MRRVGKFDAPEISGDLRVPSGSTGIAASSISRDGRLGYLKAGSHELVPIEKCPISSPMLNECIGLLNGMIKERRFPQFVKEIEVFTNETETQLNVLADRQADRPVVFRLGRRTHPRLLSTGRSRTKAFGSATNHFFR